MRFGAWVPNKLAAADDLAHLAVVAETSGWHGFFLWDHVQAGDEAEPYVDPFVALGIAAASTNTIVLGTLVTALPRVHPWDLARAASSVHDLAPGRFILGIGLGYGPELRRLGLCSHPKGLTPQADEVAFRQARRAEFVRVHRRLRTALEIARSGRPAASRPGRIPVWSAAAELADGRADIASTSVDGVALLGEEWLNGRGPSAQSVQAVRAKLPDEPATAIAVHALSGVPGQPSPKDYATAGATWWIEDVATAPQAGTTKDLPLRDVRSRIAAGPPTTELS